MTNNIPDIVCVGLARRLMAIFYDLLLLIALLFIATVIANALNHGEPIEPDNPYYPFFVLYLLVISFFLLRLVLDTRWPNIGVADMENETDQQ